MNFSKQTNQLADELINCYSNFDKLSGGYTLEISDISSIDLYKLCSLLMSDDEQVSCEAVSPDNPEFVNKMMPYLIKCMNKHGNDNKHEFVDQWKEGILSYYKNIIEELLNGRLELYNCEFGYIDKETSINLFNVEARI